MKKEDLEAVLHKYYEWGYAYVNERGTGEERVKLWGNKESQVYGQINPQLGPRIKSKKPQLSACEWCNKIADCKRSYTLEIDLKTNSRRWIHKCDTCNCSWDPKTKILKSLRTRKRAK